MVEPFVYAQDELKSKPSKNCTCLPAGRSRTRISSPKTDSRYKILWNFTRFDGFS